MVVRNQLRVVLVGIPAEEPVVPLESPPQRPPIEGACGRRLVRRSQVPLPDAKRGVALFEKDLREHAVLEPHGGVVRREA